MAAKVQHVATIAGDQPAVMAALTDLTTNPSHKWIPVDEIRDSGRASITGRQATWLSKRIAKRVKDSVLSFTALEAPSASEPEPV